MSHFRPQRSGARLLVLRLLSAAALLAAAVACSGRDAERAPSPPPAEEPLASHEDMVRKEPEFARVARPGELKEKSAGLAAPQSASQPEPAVPAPDRRALAELDYRNAQNQSQQANEALDYLGRQQLEAAPPRLADRSNLDEVDAVDSARRLLPTRALSGEAANGARVDVTAVVGGREYALDGGFAEAREGGRAGSDRDASHLSPAQRFQRERRDVENLRFQPSSGYWANTYVPGDPVLRWLESRLDPKDRRALESLAARPLALDSAARRTPQPFDPPHRAALSLFVQADRRGLEKEGRLLVQVGLQGAERRGGLRPAMSIGVVLDARGALSPDALAGFRALLQALLQAKDVGDRFSLTLAGVAGGRLVEPDAFRHGPLSLATRRLAEGAPPADGPVLGLAQALEQTSSELQRHDDPTAPLGSSMVLLVTSQPFAAQTEALVAGAHRSAVAGVPVSVVAVGDATDAGEIERVTLAGQGNRRVLRSAAEAESLVERELSALARVIARALRLNIRLAPGVRLVEVVGAERLDATGAAQVRQAERSIDQRLARSLGIEKDRGEDEDGIQIVIPTFLAGDSHAVLLDVVVPGPGPIADVRVRYKDLAYLRNSVARANLTLGSRSDPPGPLERNVVKNYLAVRLAAALKEAGRSVLEGADAQAIAVVREYRSLLASLRDEVPGFQNDPELAADGAMLGEYLALLEGDALGRDEARRYLADSLQLSGYFKTVPRTEPVLTARR